MKRVLAVIVALFVCLQPVSVRAEEEGGTVLSNACDAEELHIKMPFSTVKALCEGGTGYLDQYGVTRQKLVAELSAHEHDNYYLGTPYVGGDCQSPNGDISYNGYRGMNCAGFVGYVLRKCGMDASAVMKTMQKGPSHSFGSALPYGMFSAASNYFNWVRYGNLKAYVFPNKTALLASGKCEKGDLILRYWTSNFTGDDEDNHMMIFWGSKPNEDKIWHSPASGNEIGPLYAGSNASFILIKFAPEKPVSPPVAGFEDVREGHWYADAVRYVKENNLMNGTGRKTFTPKGVTTRGQIVTILYRMAGEPAVSGSSGFTDVPDGKWYSNAVSWAVENGIVRGYQSGRFFPNSAIKRQDMAVILYNYCRLLGVEVTEGKDLSNYADSSEVGEYALEAMRWANTAGLITGVRKDTLSPKGNTIRAQAAAVLMRFCKQYGHNTAKP